MLRRRVYVIVVVVVAVLSSTAFSAEPPKPVALPAEKSAAEIARVFPTEHPPFIDQAGTEAEKQYTARVLELYDNEDFAAIEAWIDEAAKDTVPLTNGKQKFVALFDALAYPSSPHLQKPQARVELCTRWLKAFPRSSTAAAIRIRSQLNYAWEARGSGYASSISDEGYKLFIERLTPIAGWTEEAEQGEINNPLYCDSAIDFAKSIGQPKVRVDQLVEIAAKVPIWTYRPYLAATEYYLPRWYGGPGDMERFALRVYELTKNRLGAEAYTQIVVQVSRYHGSTTFQDFQFSWPLIQQGFCDAAARVPNRGADAVQYGWLARYADRRQEAKVLFDYLGDAGADFWRSDLYQQLRAWAQRDPSNVGKTIFEFQSWIGRLLWSPDGNGLLFSTYEGVSRLDLQTGRSQLVVPMNRTSWFDLSADGSKLVLVTSDGKALLVDTQAGSLEQLYQSPDSVGFTIVYCTPDDRVLARNTKGMLFAWKLKGERDPKEFPLPNRPLAYESLSADGREWFKRPAKSDGLSIWDATTGTLKQEWIAKTPTKPFIGVAPPPLPRTYIPDCVALSPDGKRAVVSSRGRLRLWNIGEAAPKVEAEFGDGGVTHAAFTADGRRLLTAMWRIAEYREAGVAKFGETTSEILLWNVDDLTVLKKYEGHDASVAYVAVSPDGKRFASSSHDATVRLWDLP